RWRFVARLGPRSHRAVADRYADAYFHSVEYTYAQPYFYTFPYPYLHAHPHADTDEHTNRHTDIDPDCNAIAHTDHRATEQNGEEDRVVPRGGAGSRLHLQQGVSLFLPARLTGRQL
ncbi:MAG: hypothetical protein OXG09_12160, partial [Chloroflexi bacterium]|nr:hypothetical protein [Chloroflexota bacterium]